MARKIKADTFQKNTTYFKRLYERFTAFCDQRGQPAGHSINAAMWMYLHATPDERERASVEMVEWLEGGEGKRKK